MFPKYVDVSEIPYVWVSGLKLKGDIPEDLGNIHLRLTIFATATMLTYSPAFWLLLKGYK